MSDDTFKDEFVPNAEGHTYHPKWVKANPVEATKWAGFRDKCFTYKAGDVLAVPSMATKYGKHLVAAGKLHMSVTDIGAQYNPPPPDPPPGGGGGITGTPFFNWNGTGGNYQPLSTIFAAYTTDPRIKDWGGNEASNYDLSNPGYLGGPKMSTDQASTLRVHLVQDPVNPNGSGWCSRQEIRTTDPPWNQTGGSNYDKSSIRNLEGVTFPQGGGYAAGRTVWFAWEFFLPLNYNGNTFNWATSTFHTLMDLHGSGSNFQQNWNVLEAVVGPLGSNNVWVRYHMGAHEGSSDPAPDDTEFVNLVQLTNSTGQRVTSSYNTWHEMVVGVKFASDGTIGSSTGWIEIWLNGINVLPQHFRPTAFPNESDVWMQGQNYKQHSAALFGGATSSVIYYGAMRSGLTRADVQRVH